MAATKVEIWNRALSRIGMSTQLTIEDENSTKLAAGQCRLHYLGCLKETLENDSFPWPFALRQATLQLELPDYDADTTYAVDDEVAYGRRRYKSLQAANLRNTPGGADTAAYWAEQGPWYSGWGHVYTLPTDHVTALALVPEGYRAAQLAREDRVPFELMANQNCDGQVLCTDGEQGGDFDVLEYVALVQNVSIYPELFASAIAYRLAAELALTMKQDAKLSLALRQGFEIEVARAKVHALKGRQDDPPPRHGLVAAQGFYRLPDAWRRRTGR